MMQMRHVWPFSLGIWFIFVPIIIWHVSIEESGKKSNKFFDNALQLGCFSLAFYLKRLVEMRLHSSWRSVSEHLVELVFCVALSKQKTMRQRDLCMEHKIEEKCRAWLLSCVSIAFGFILHSIDKKQHLDLSDIWWKVWSRIWFFFPVDSFCLVKLKSIFLVSSVPTGMRFKCDGIW